MRRAPRQSRALGLWTAAWLFGLLLAGLLWVGNPAVQWPVLLVPVLWALVAARPRRGERGARYVDPTDRRPSPPRDMPPPRQLPPPRQMPPPRETPPRETPPRETPPRELPPPRQLPPTREMPWVSEPPPDRRGE